MNIFVTGGAGFIGSHFINEFYKQYINKTNKEQFNIINFDALYYCSNEENVNADIRNDREHELTENA